VICEFADHSLDIDRFELHRDATRVEMQPLAFDLLVYLVRNRNRVVTKAELRDVVWHGVHVSQAAVARAVMKVRRAIGDDGEQQRLIATIHSRGYRFVGWVETREPLADVDALGSRSIAA
jgi:DNA-binding winged helix-turn-helix (wHTH) protein